MPAPVSSSIPFNWTKENFEQQAKLLRQGVSSKAVLRGGENLTAEEQRSVLMGKDIGRPVQFATKEDIESLISGKRQELGLPDPNAPKPTPPPAPTAPAPSPSPSPQTTNLVTGGGSSGVRGGPYSSGLTTAMLHGGGEAWEYRQVSPGRFEKWGGQPVRDTTPRSVNLTKLQQEAGQEGLDIDIGQWTRGRVARPGEGFTNEIPWSEAQAALQGARLRKQEVEQAQTQRASQEKTYDQAIADVEYAKELAAQRVPGAMTEAVAAKSAAQSGIAGGTQAGRTLAGEFKSPYEVGSILPASWMRSISAEDIAKKASGLESRTEGSRVQGARTGRQISVGVQKAPGSYNLSPTRSTGLGRTT